MEKVQRKSYGKVKFFIILLKIIFGGQVKQVEKDLIHVDLFKTIDFFPRFVLYFELFAKIITIKQKMKEHLKLPRR